MKYLIMLLLLMVNGCVGRVNPIYGRVLAYVSVCTETEQCQNEILKNCPAGAIVQAQPALKVVYSCQVPDEFVPAPADAEHLE